MRMPCSDGAVSYRCIGMILRSMYLATPALFYVFCRDVERSRGNVGAIYAMGKLLFVTIVVVERFEQLFVEIFPSFESETFPENTGICMGSDQSGFDENGSRPAHRVYKVGFSVPPRFQYHSGSQYFVDGGLRFVPRGILACVETLPNCRATACSSCAIYGDSIRVPLRSTAPKVVCLSSP